MSRLPIRLRLALFFAAAAAVLLTAVGGFGYLRLADGLVPGPRPRAAAAGPGPDRPGEPARTRRSPTSPGTGFIERGESFAEVVTPAGPAGASRRRRCDDRPLLTPAEAATGGARARSPSTAASAPGSRRAGPAPRHAVHPRRPRASCWSWATPARTGWRTLRTGARPAAGRDPAAGAPHVPRCVRRRRRRAASGRGDATPRRRSSPRAIPALRLPDPGRGRRDRPSRGHAQRAAGPGRGGPSSGSARSWRTRATSCAPRSPCCGPSSSWRSGARDPRPSWPRRSARREVEVDRLQRLAEDLLLLAQAG